MAFNHRKGGSNPLYLKLNYNNAKVNSDSLRKLKKSIYHSFQDIEYYKNMSDNNKY